MYYFQLSYECTFLLNTFVPSGWNFGLYDGVFIFPFSVPLFSSNSFGSILIFSHFRLLRMAIREGQEAQQESLQVIRRFETTCGSVLGLLPDLSLAVTERQPQLAIDLFEDIRNWVNGLRTLVESHQTRIATFIQHVSDLIEEIRIIKTAADQKFLNAVAELPYHPAICDEPIRVHSVDSLTPHPDVPVVVPSRIPRVESDDSKALSDRKTGSISDDQSQTGFQEWYDDVRETVLGQLESLVGTTVEHMVGNSTDSSTAVPKSEPSTNDPGGISHIANELLDLLFISPGSWAEQQRILASRKCLKADNTDRRHSDKMSSPNLKPSLLDQSFPLRSRSHSNPDSTRTGSDDSDNAVSHRHPTTDAECDGLLGGDHHRHRSSWRVKNGRRWRNRQQLYTRALKTSEILVRALDEIRRVRFY